MTIPNASEPEEMNDDPRLTMILEELRSINTKLDSYTERTAVMETQIKPLFPNGQPGMLADFDERIKSLEKFYWYGYGAFIVVAGLATVAWEWVKTLVR
jgi:hypothetical protein